MLAYLMRRFMYAIPILLGVNIITFALFFMVNSPDDIARMRLGQKYVSSVQIQTWKKEHHYDLPLFLNEQASGWQSITETLFFQKSAKLFMFDFGESDAGRNIQQDIQERMFPSLYVAVPVLFFELILNIAIALLLVFFRMSYIDVLGTIFCVGMLSISSLFYVIVGQYMFSKVLQLVPISGYADGWYAYKFLMLPIIVGVIASLGSGVRWYRSIFLEEINKNYVVTVRAKGLPEYVVLFQHVLRNGMIPILTGVVVIIPTLFMGSLILESFFGIPGLGSYTIDAIQAQDFAIVRVMVFLGSIFYIAGLMLTDIAYVLVDPRVKLNGVLG